MFNNPYFGGFREQQPQQPIQNIFTNQMPSGQDIFMARFLKDGENVDNILITNKTAFIDLTNNKLIIKDMDLSKRIYEIVPPKDAKDIQIEQLQSQINQLKEMIRNESNVNASTTNASTEQNGDDKKSSRK